MSDNDGPNGALIRFLVIALIVIALSAAGIRIEERTNLIRHLFGIPAQVLPSGSSPGGR